MRSIEAHHRAPAGNSMWEQIRPVAYTSGWSRIDRSLNQVRYSQPGGSEMLLAELISQLRRDTTHDA